ncbi:hypothetical protein DSC45_35365 [Streptomyces sp. YIM 130001]|nr:hypothetical protein DSC45_35365 [Streptomyces sp. YIM 130001]
MVLKQCGQVETIFFAVFGFLVDSSSSSSPKAAFRVATFSIPSSWNSGSLPSRRAESPVHFSSPPMIANLTPAMCSSSAKAFVVFFARSSNAPAQPTQYRYSTSVRSSIVLPTTGTSKSTSLVHSRRCFFARPQGLPFFSRFLSIVPASLGKLDSIITW